MLRITARVPIGKGGHMPVWGADARYERLVALHSASLVRLAFLLTANRADAEDAVQEALISVAAKWSSVVAPTELSYLRRAVANAALDLLRRKRDIATEVVPDRVVSDRGLIRLEEDQQFFERVAELPTRQRAVLVLRYYADLDDRAIAGVLDCSVSTVRSQVHHALAKLRAVTAGEESR